MTHKQRSCAHMSAMMVQQGDTQGAKQKVKSSPLFENRVFHWLLKTNSFKNIGGNNKIK